MNTLETTIAATDRHRSAPDDGEQCVDATEIVNDPSPRSPTP
jgi:hypothetical protein